MTDLAIEEYYVSLQFLDFARVESLIYYLSLIMVFLHCYH